MKTETLTYPEALENYFGGIKKMASAPLPFKCICGGEIWHVHDAWSHIRKTHKERIRKNTAQEPSSRNISNI